MSIDLVRLVVDFGFLILIWAVQLVIYPSFNYYSIKNLYKWHKSYTKRVTFIVLPLMFGQLILVTIQFWQIQNWFTILSSVIVITLWLLTFLVFIPLHQSIDNSIKIDNVCNKLVIKNWLRTLLWTVLFVISIVNYTL